MLLVQSTSSRARVRRRTAARKLDEVEFLAFLGSRNVGGDEGVHESLKVWSPPLRQCIANLPLIVDTFACKLCADRCKALVQPCLEAFDLVVFSAEVIARSTACQMMFSQRLHGTHSLKKAFAICSIRM
jgi:hypothetical protein